MTEELDHFIQLYTQIQSHSTESQAIAFARHAAYYKNIAASYNDKTWQKVLKNADQISVATNRICTFLKNETISQLGELNSPKTLPDDNKIAATIIVDMIPAIRDYLIHQRVQFAYRWLQTGLASARLLGKKDTEYLMLGFLGGWFTSKGQLLTALSYYEQLEKSGEIYDYRSLSVCLDTGSLYRELGQTSKAFEYFEKALAIIESTNDQSYLAVALLNLGMTYRSIGQYQKAIEYLERAQNISEERQDLRNLAIALTNLGLTCSTINQQQRALEYHERVTQIYEEDGNKVGLAGALSNIGMVYFGTNKLEKSMLYFKRALSILEETPDLSKLSSVIANIASIHSRQGQTTEALELYERALPAAEQSGQRQNLAGILMNMGMDYQKIGKPDKALESLENSLKIYREIGATQFVVTAMWNIATLFSDEPSLGHQTEAISIIKEALNIMKQAKLNNDGLGRSQEEYQQHADNLKLMIFTNNLELISIISKFVDAPTWDASREVLNANPKLLDSVAESVFEVMIWAEKNENEVAKLKLHYQLLSQCKTIGIEQAFNGVRAVSKNISIAQSQDTNDLFARGMTLYQNRQLDQAIDCFSKIIQSNPNHAGAYLSRGSCFEQLKRYVDALNDFNHAIEIGYPDMSGAYYCRGVAYLRLNRYTESLSDLEKSIQLNPENGSSYFNIGAIFYSLGQIETALPYYEKAEQLGVTQATQFTTLIKKKLGNNYKATTLDEKQQYPSGKSSNSCKVCGKTLSFVERLGGKTTCKTHRGLES